MLQGRAKTQAESLAWCPDEYLPWYRHYINLRFSASEARTLVEDHMAVVERRKRSQAA